MIDTVDYKPEHMAKVKIAEDEKDVLLFLDNLDSRAEAYAKCGRAITLMKDGEVMAIGGVIQFWTGSGELWMMVSPEGRLHKVALYKAMSGFIDRCISEYGFHRVQAVVVEGHHQSHNCMMRLGFIPEGMMVHYGPGRENFVRYVRLGG